MRLLSFPVPAALSRVSAALALSAMLTSALATPVAEMRAEDYLPMAAELKKSLNLNANQQTLWSQTESRTRKLLAERKARRERLQAAALAGAQGANAELRDLARRWMRKPPQRRRGKAAARMVADCQRRPDRKPAPDGGAAGGRAVATCAR
jgi:hypothetical protein